jgi:hypothetical protein
MRAWNVVWGRTEGDVVIENGFMDIRNGLITKPSGSAIRTDGRYALGYKPGKEEMNGRIAVRSWPLDEFRTAFGLSDWPVDGTLAQGDFQLHGPYQQLLGTGKIQIETGVAWGEPFEQATADLGFEGDGMRLSRLVMTKGPGEVTGDAWIGWNGTYVFAVDGARLPVESLSNFKVPQAPLSGVLQFKARGDGRFDAPSYEFDGTVADLYAGGRRHRPGPRQADDQGRCAHVRPARCRLESFAGDRVRQHRAQRASRCDDVSAAVRHVARSVSEILRAGDVAVHARDRERHGGREGSAPRPRGSRGGSAHPRRRTPSSRSSTTACTTRARCGSRSRRTRSRSRGSCWPGKTRCSISAARSTPATGA